MGCVEHKTLKKLRVGRNFVLNNVSSADDFLSHHLTSELQLTQRVSADLIHKRQIIEHVYIKVQTREDYTRLIMLEKAWIQGLFIKFMKEAEQQFFSKQNKRSFKDIRADITEKLLFELYQLKEFFQSSMARVEKINYAYGMTEEVHLSAIMLLADSALYEEFGQIASRFKITQEARIIFPRIQTLRNHVNLLTRFPAQIIRQTTYDNINLLYKDLKFLLRAAVKEFPTFRHDMKELFGGDLAADLKVKEREVHDKKGFSSVGFRRILVKWAETLLQIWPEMVSSIHFLRFIEKKNKIFDDFTFGGSASFSNQINNLLVNLIYSAQFNTKTKKRNKQFGFYIYDLLRCKVHTSSSFEAFDLLRKIKSMESTISGRKLQVVRVKNRLDSHNRDILVNFLYGDILVAQAQIAVVSGFYNQTDSKKYHMKHYIYEFERSIFGPTIQLILEYEDSHSKDESAQLYAKGRVRKSGRQFPKYFIKHSQTKCPSKHFCLQITGNMFNNNDDEFICDCCSNQASFDSTYFHCYKCSLLFCSECDTKYLNDFSPLAASVNEDRLKPLHDRLDVIAALNKVDGIVLLLTLQYSPSSRLYLNFISYYLVSKSSACHLNSPMYHMIRSDRNKDFIAQIGIESFPSLVLLNQSFKPVKYIIGVEILKLSDFLSACNSFIDNGVYKFVAKCPQQHEMKTVMHDYTQNWECSQCSASTISSDKLFNSTGQIVQCSKCNYVLCNNCGFLAVTDNDRYQDRYGESYLSTKPLKQQPIISCPKNSSHRMRLRFDNFQNKPSYKCSKCQSQFFFTEDQGVTYCEECECVVCEKCQGIRRPIDPRLKEIEYVSHYAEITANDGINCEQCHKPYKKAYDTRNNSATWKCKLCEKTFTKNIMHLSCFRCNIHFCTNCVYTFRILRAAFSFQFPNESLFVCAAKHEVRELNGPENKHEDQGTFKCTHCEGLFYIDSVRYICRQCDITSCAECLIDCFQYNDTVLRCNSGHELEQLDTKTTPIKGFYCKICLDYTSEKEIEEVWKCPSCSNYQICMQCSCRMLNKPYERKFNREKCQCGKTLKCIKRGEENLSVCHYCESMIKETVNWSCKYCQIVICLECLI